MNSELSEIVTDIANGNFNRLEDMADLLDKSGQLESANRVRQIHDLQLGNIAILQFFIDSLTRSQLVAFRMALTSEEKMPMQFQPFKVSDSQFELLEFVIGSMREYVMTTSMTAWLNADHPDNELQRQLRIIASLFSHEREVGEV